MIGFAIGASFTISSLDRGDLERVFHLIGDALISRQGPESQVLDHAVSIDLGKGLVEIEVTTTGDTRAQAEALAERTIAEVLQQTGGRDIASTFASMRAEIHEAGLEVVLREEVLV